MIENKTKHTFVLTIDNATGEAAEKNPVLMGKLKLHAMMLGMESKHGKLNKQGMHYMRTVEA